MSNNFTLSPKDHLQYWQQRAPHMCCWLRVSDNHLFINNGQLSEVTPFQEIGLVAVCFS